MRDVDVVEGGHGKEPGIIPFFEMPALQISEHCGKILRIVRCLWPKLYCPSSYIIPRP